MALYSLIVPLRNYSLTPTLFGNVSFAPYCWLIGQLMLSYESLHELSAVKKLIVMHTCAFLST